MKVALIHNQFKTSGGMESYLLTLVHGFLQAGDEVHVHTYELDHQLAGSYDCTIHQMRLFLLPRRLRKYYFLKRMNRGFRRGDYDLSLSLTRTSCQDVAIVGGVHPQSVLRAGRRGWYRSIHDRVETRYEGAMFSGVPWIVAHSRAIQEEIEHHYPVDPAKIKVLYPPIDGQRFAQVDQDARTSAAGRFGCSPDKLTLLFPSMSHKRKGLAELLQAYKGLDPASHELIVVGDPGRGYPADPRVRFFGYVEDMASLYQAVDYLVLPSHYEPFGLVVAEALHCRTPVLVTASVGAAELLEPGDGVVVADNAPATLAGVIAGLRPRLVEPGFAGRHQLETGQHIEALKELAGCRSE
ncbi:glycosyltransferase family 4 protein [Desulfogranum mediterraneum]|uniref:glycosyltransferase family 4 protein n=1 Tax=Desulfogranum mediterraneum TaxID=160661 RepID=UPI0003F7BCC5|nr:glycosyltransferase family 4 protein [Desulfogranum mediterraneum]